MTSLQWNQSSQSDFAPIRVDAATAARRLLGCILERTIDEAILRVRIVEVEAYDEIDAASHAVTGPNGRARTMFGPAGCSYVYFTYGMHHCCNIVTGPDGYGSGALIRAVEPLEDYPSISRRRGGRIGADRTNGPAKVCQAMDITRQLDGHDLHEAPLRLVMQPALPDSLVIEATRVGISKAIEVKWRFYIKDNAYVSVRV